VKLYNANLSPNCLRVRAVASELDAALEVVDIEPFRAGPDRERLLAINANGKVPVLDDDGFVLWESRAITRYLASLHGNKLYPIDAKTRATIDQWSFWQAIHLGPAMQALVFENVLKAKFGMGEPDPAVVKSKLAETVRYLAVLEQALEGTWIAGEISLADFALASTFMLREPAGISLSSTPRVAAWIERVEALESWQIAVKPLLPLFEG